MCCGLNGASSKDIRKNISLIAETETPHTGGRWNDDVDPSDFNQQKLEFCRPRFSAEFSSAQAFS